MRDERSIRNSVQGRGSGLSKVTWQVRSRASIRLQVQWLWRRIWPVDARWLPGDWASTRNKQAEPQTDLWVMRRWAKLTPPSPGSQVFSFAPHWTTVSRLLVFKITFLDASWISILRPPTPCYLTQGVSPRLPTATHLLVCTICLRQRRFIRWLTPVNN